MRFHVLSLEMLEMNQPHLCTTASKNQELKKFWVMAFKDKSVIHTIDTMYHGSKKWT